MKRPKYNLLCLCVLLIFIVGLPAGGVALAQDTPPFDVTTLAAQSVGSLSIGESGAGELSADAPAHWWALPLHYGDTIFIATNAAPDTMLLPQIYLVGPDGYMVAQDENPAYGQNVLIRQFTALADGTYYLNVRALRQGVGAYTLVIGRLPATPEGQATATPFLTSTPAAPPTALPDAPAVDTTPTAQPDAGQQSVLYIGQSVDVTLPPGARHRYTFEGVGGMPLVIELSALNTTSASFDPYLELYGPSGALLFENDDADYGQIDARLVVTLPATGSYTLVARSLGDRAGGGYHLSARVGALWQ